MLEFVHAELLLPGAVSDGASLNFTKQTNKQKNSAKVWTIYFGMELHSNLYDGYWK